MIIVIIIVIIVIIVIISRYKRKSRVICINLIRIMLMAFFFSISFDSNASHIARIIIAPIIMPSFEIPLYFYIARFNSSFISENN